MVRRTAKRKGIAGLLLGGAAVMVLAVVGYAPSLNGEFLWDDHDNVAANPMLHDLEGLYETWASPFANIQYYPITHTSFWLEHRIWGSWPAGYRITNLLLHGVVAVLIGLVLVRLEVPGAGLAAAIFALHPVHVETVAWITERKNILSALFYLAAMLAYLRFAGLGGRDGECSGRRRWSYLLALVLFAAALLSKTAVLTLPLALWIILWWKKGRLDRADLLATGPMLAMAVGLGLVTVWLESNHLGASGPEWYLGVLERVLVAGRAFWFYLSKLAMPVGLNFIYPRWPIDAAAVWQYLFPAALLASFWTLWIFRNRIGKAPLAGALFFAVTLAPSLGLLGFYFQIYSFVQDHHQYLASAGLIGLWTALATVGLTRFDRRFGGGIAVLLLLALTGAT